jgi:nucleotide-binding universal stress UspA family protein
MFEKILVAIDGSTHSERAAAAGIEMARLYGSVVTVLYVVDISKEYAPLGDLVSKVVEDPFAAMRDTLQKQGDEAIKRIEEMAKAAGISAVRKIIEGYPADAIISVAEKENMDLIVVGYIGVSGLERFLLGSVADKVVRNSKVPVLVVR